jgi:hypothetical protein
MNDDTIVDRIERVEKDVEKANKEICSLKDQGTETTKAMIRFEIKQDYQIQSTEKLEKAIQLLTDRPSKRLDLIVTTIITVAITAVLAFFIGKLTGK